MPRELDADDIDAEPPGPVVVLIPEGDAFAVMIEPPLPSGDHHRTCWTKQDGYAVARELWCHFRLGFSDRTAPNFGRFGPNSRTLENRDSL